MAFAPPIPFTDSLETRQKNEEDTIQELNETFDKILDTTAKDYGHAVRSVHAKAHGILQGTLTVASDLSPELAQGMFAGPGKHIVFMRLSTNAGDILPDTISLPRGLALKVLNVDGERLPGAEGRTQNFVMINGPVFQAKTADKFLGSLKKLAGTTDRMEGVKAAMSTVMQGVSSALETVGIESPTIQSMGGAPNVDPLGETYYSVTPFRYGDYVAKFAVVPVSENLKSLTKKEIDATDRPNAIRQNVEGEMLVTDGVWELRVQLCRDLEKQPIEDSTVEWKEEDSPFQTVATIHAGRQDSWDAAKLQKVDEEMRFSPWIGLVAHRPLGNINRARKEPYEHSAEYRARFNRCPIHEPSGAEA
jgi:catalase